MSGNECFDDGCLLDENIISVVIPKRFKVTQYGGSPRGNWKIVDNTFTYCARNVKGARVEIDFEERYAATFDNVNASMEKLKGVEARNVEGTIKIIMPMDNVFAPGSVVMSAQGSTWVKSLGGARGPGDARVPGRRPAGAETDGGRLRRQPAEGETTVKNLPTSLAASIAAALLLPGTAVAQPTERPLVDKPPT